MCRVCCMLLSAFSAPILRNWHLDTPPTTLLHCRLSSHLAHNEILLVFQFSTLTGSRRVGHANGQHQNSKTDGPMDSQRIPQVRSPSTTSSLLVIIAFFPRHLQICTGILPMEFGADSQLECLRMLLCSVHSVPARPDAKRNG